MSLPFLFCLRPWPHTKHVWWCATTASSNTSDALGKRVFGEEGGCGPFVWRCALSSSFHRHLWTHSVTWWECGLYLRRLCWLSMRAVHGGPRGMSWAAATALTLFFSLGSYMPSCVYVLGLPSLHQLVYVPCLSSRATSLAGGLDLF